MKVTMKQILIGGFTVFNQDREKFDKFMETESEYLGGEKPIEVCETEEGRVLVYQLLARIEN